MTMHPVVAAVTARITERSNHPRSLSGPHPGGRINRTGSNVVGVQ
jgi:hypothetical protein